MLASRGKSAAGCSRPNCGDPSNRSRNAAGKRNIGSKQQPRESPNNQGYIEQRQKDSLAGKRFEVQEPQNQVATYQNPEQSNQTSQTVLEEELSRIDPQHIKDLALIGLDMLKAGRTPGTIPINNHLIQNLRGMII